MENIRFQNYEQRHVQLAGWLIAPVMLLELVTTLFILITDTNLLTITATALLATIWFSTFAFQVPIHRKLEKTFSMRDIDKLIRSNWTRTLGWTLKSVIVLIMLVK